MQKLLSIICVLLLLFGSVSLAQNTTVTIGTVTSAQIGDTIKVPVNVSNFVNVNSIDFKIAYDSNVLSFVDCADSKVNFVIDNTSGRLAMVWYDYANSVNITRGLLVNLKFIYKGGSCNVDFSQAELSNQSGQLIPAVFSGSTVGNVSVMKFGKITNSGSTYSVPVNVTNFKNIGSFTLKIKYDPAVMTYVSYANKPAGGSFFATALNGVLTVVWASSLPTSLINIDDDTLFTLNFTYAGAGQSGLTFDKLNSEVTNGEQKKVSISYFDGTVGTIPTLTFAKPTVNGTAVNVPLNAKDFNSIGSFTFKINYDPAVLTYSGVDNQPSNGTFFAEAANGVLTVIWASSSPTSLLSVADGKLFSLNFTYAGVGQSSLAFDQANCEVTTGDQRKVSVNYVNGSVGVLPTLTFAKATVNGTAVSVSLNAKDFTKIGSFTLKINYDPAVLTYTGYSDKPATGTFLANSSNGSLAVVWSSANATDLINIADGKLFTLNFTYSGSGQSSLTFDKLNSEVTSGDQKKVSVNYVDGTVGTIPTLTFGKPVVAGATVSVPVTAKELNNIGSFTLRIKYDPGVLTYSDIANKPAVGDLMANAENGELVVVWTSSSPTSLLNVAEGNLFIVNFSANGGYSPLAFNAANSEFTQGSGKPIKVNYVDGVFGKSAKILIPKVTADMGANVSIPVIMQNFQNVGVISLKVKYDPNMLSYLDYSGALDGTLVYAEDNTIAMSWFNVSPMSCDSIKFISLNFKYNGGSGILEIDKNFTEIYDSTGNNKFYVDLVDGTINVTGIKDIPGTIPDTYSISQNFPNPFNPTTKIEYAIPQESKVTLKVYNLIGQEVATLVNQVQNSGKYIVDFNASNLPSGMYIYKIDAGTFSQVRKMTLLK